MLGMAIRSVTLGFLATALLAGAARAQRFEPTRFAATAESRSSLAIAQVRPSGCSGRRIGTVALYAGVGAVMGYAMFTFGIGALASDHGTVYRRERRRWVLISTGAGAAIGTFRAIAYPCHRLP
ncbi:MAG TPA: hypothetical protein VEB19_03235 [Gemmatimonadaceae bacterium]|nr:hypothetical protein [Gemmatimonadaceae bacterium]